MSSIGPLALKNNLNDLKKLNTSSMTNGSAEFIHLNKNQTEKSEKKSNRNLDSPSGRAGSNRQENLSIKLEFPKEDNLQIVSNDNNGKTNGLKEIKEIINLEERENLEKSNQKKSKQVIFSEKDKVITVDNWKKYNLEKTRKCKCNLI